MTVDLHKAKAGDTVKFRCGGEATIRGISPRDYNGFVVTMKEYEHKHWYGGNGLSGTDGGEHPLDIISITPSAEVFDWNGVKYGMGFKDTQEGDIVIYVGDHIGDKTYAVVQIPNGGALRFEAFTVMKDNLTRAPEHDVEEYNANQVA